MLRLQIAHGCGPTGRLLRDLLKELGLQVTTLEGTAADAVVCYGAGSRNPRVPTLNANAGKLDKYEQFLALQEAGVQVPTFFAGDTNGMGVHYPLLARKRQHHGGKDIMLVLQQEDLALRRRAGADFFVEYVPRKTEFRCWIYRRQHLGTYEKVLKHPEQYTKVGCNYDNGFAFDLVGAERVPRAAVELAAQAVQTLGLDFGAVDVLQGTDGQFYVLEVNTAPGVDGPRQGINKLVEKIQNWVRLGYPKRKGAEQPW